ncbi:MAG: TlpA family protein disulfide reductase [Quinella sp. 1Q5]|nr:TlpA family protein disulfide reductase [Quinella sp. 1Q5]
MTKKLFAVALLCAAMMISGCSDSAQVESTTNTAQASPVAKSVPAFTTKTITGETVTNEIFVAKKITVVNIWGTFCPPCIAEMPELGDMARNLPEGAQLIGLVCDATDGSPQIQKALQITKEAGADFVNVIPDENLLRFMEGVEAVPTTIFINSKGEVVGKAIIGADVDGYKDELQRLLAQ